MLTEVACYLQKLRLALVPTQKVEQIYLLYEAFTLVFRENFEDNAGYKEQQSGNDKHDGADKRREARHQVRAPKFDKRWQARAQSAQRYEHSKRAEERHWLVFANHSENC